MDCGAKSKGDGKVNSCKTVLNLANTILGGGVLAVPYAFSLTNYWAMLVLFLVLGLTTFTAILIGDELKMAKIEVLDDSKPANSRDFTYLAEISFGLCGKGIVAVITIVEVWVGCVTGLVLSADNIRAVLSLSQTQAVLLCLLLCTVMVFIPLRLYAYISLASLVALLMASSCYIGELFIIPTCDWSLPPMEWTPDPGDLFRAYGLFMVSFGGHPCLPVFHERMQNTQRWTSCVSWTFSLAVLFYLAVGLLSFLARGDEIHPVLTDNMMGVPSMKDLTVALFAVKIQSSTPFLMRVVFLSLQIWPSTGNVKEVSVNVLFVALVIIMTGIAACFLAGHVAALASLAGSLVINLTSLIIPCLVYVKLSLHLLGWSDQPCKNKAKLLMCGVVMAVGLITAVAGTYLAVLDVSDGA